MAAGTVLAFDPNRCERGKRRTGPVRGPPVAKRVGKRPLRDGVIGMDDLVVSGAHGTVDFRRAPRSLPEIGLVGLTPAVGRLADRLAEHPAEVSLIREAATQGNVAQRGLRRYHRRFCPGNSHHHDV